MGNMCNPRDHCGVKNQSNLKFFNRLDSTILSQSVRNNKNKQLIDVSTTQSLVVAGSILASGVINVFFICIFNKIYVINQWLPIIWQ